MSWQFWRRNRRNEELAEELSGHLILAEAEEMESGRTKKEAQAAARRHLGNLAVTEEVTRDTWGGRWLADVLQDTRFGLRILRHKPGFVVVALLMLALGTGATTVMFTVVNGVILKSLPYLEPDRLVGVHGYTSAWNVSAYGKQNVAYPDFLDCQREVRSLDIAGVLGQVGGTVSEPGDPEYVEHREISSNFFSVLGVAPIQGRALLPEEDQLGGDPVVVLGFRFWQRRFAGSPSALGARLVLNDKPYTVVGVMPASLRLDVDIFTPVGQDAATFLHARRAHPIGVVARLRPGVTLAQAQAELELVGRRLARQYRDTNADRSFQAELLAVRSGDPSAADCLRECRRPPARARRGART